MKGFYYCFKRACYVFDLRFDAVLNRMIIVLAVIAFGSLCWNLNILRYRISLTCKLMVRET